MRSAHTNHEHLWPGTRSAPSQGLALPPSLPLSGLGPSCGIWHQSSLLPPAPSTPRLRNVGKNPPLPLTPIDREHFWGVGWVETVEVLEGCGTCH